MCALGPPYTGHEASWGTAWHGLVAKLRPFNKSFLRSSGPFCAASRPKPNWIAFRNGKKKGPESEIPRLVAFSDMKITRRPLNRGIEKTDFHHTKGKRARDAAQATTRIPCPRFRRTRRRPRLSLVFASYKAVGATRPSATNGAVRSCYSGSGQYY